MDMDKFKFNRIILASKSQARRNLIANLGIKAEIFVTGADETLYGDYSPENMVTELSERKAKKALEDLKDAESLIITADTVVVYNGRILGKPSGEDDAFKTLSMMSGNSHEVYSGITLAVKSLNNQVKVLADYDVTKVKFREISPYEIDLYIKTGDPLSKAGSYGAEGIGATFIERIEGDFFNIVGLPLNKFAGMLKTGWGLTIFDLI